MTREEAIDLLDTLIGMVEDSRNSDYDTAFRMGIKALEQEPKTGHWIDYGTKYDVRCSICNTQYPFKPIGSSRLMGCKSNYCPGCGAKMIETQESEE